MKITASAATAIIALACALPAAAQESAPNVSVNGRVVALSPQPIVRAGRVFVPLRGVFERLGATVVYANGEINATSGRRTVSLAIGSTQAQVDGAPRLVDVAPFIIGASTYVPLRFVSQALGASVQYDGANDLVAIDTHDRLGYAPPREVVTPLPVARRDFDGAALRDERPRQGEAILGARPTIGATFARPVEAGSVRVMLDGLDVSADIDRSPDGFRYAPSAPLQNASHEVAVEGRFVGGEPFRMRWSFTTEAPNRDRGFDSDGRRF